MDSPELRQLEEKYPDVFTACVVTGAQAKGKHRSMVRKYEQVVLSLSYRQEVMQLVHDPSLSVHLGTKKILEQIS